MRRNEMKEIKWKEKKAKAGSQQEQRKIQCINPMQNPVHHPQYML